MTKGGLYAAGALLAAAGTGVLTGPAAADVTQPEPWQMGLQPAATPIMEMIHRFNDLGMRSLDPRWAGGRPRQITTTDRALIVETAKTRPTKLGLPFTHWSIRKLGRRWNSLHKLVYVAIAGGAIHFIMSVKSWPAEPVIYAGIVGALLLWRLMRPHARNRKPVAAPRGQAIAAKK